MVEVKKLNPEEFSEARKEVEASKVVDCVVEEKKEVKKSKETLSKGSEKTKAVMKLLKNKKNGMTRIDVIKQLEDKNLGPLLYNLAKRGELEVKEIDGKKYFSVKKGE